MAAFAELIQIHSFLKFLHENAFFIRNLLVSVVLFIPLSHVFIGHTTFFTGKNPSFSGNLVSSQTKWGINGFSLSLSSVLRP